jgi:hypothetical protein
MLKQDLYLPIAAVAITVAMRVEMVVFPVFFVGIWLPYYPKK